MEHKENQETEEGNNIFFKKSYYICYLKTFLVVNVHFKDEKKKKKKFCIILNW